MKKKTADEKILRLKFSIDPDKGAAATLSGLNVEGRPFISMIRRGTNVTITYGPKS